MHTLDALLTRLIAMAHHPLHVIRLFLLLALALGVGSTLQSLNAQGVRRLVRYEIELSPPIGTICLGETVVIDARIRRRLDANTTIYSAHGTILSFKAIVDNPNILSVGMGILTDDVITPERPFSQGFSFTGQSAGTTTIHFQGSVDVTVRPTENENSVVEFTRLLKRDLEVTVVACEIRVDLTSTWNITAGSAKFRFALTLQEGLLKGDNAGFYKGAADARVVVTGTFPPCGTQTITTSSPVEMSGDIETSDLERAIHLILRFDGVRQDFDLTSNCRNAFEGIANAFIDSLDVLAPIWGGAAFESTEGLGDYTPRHNLRFVFGNYQTESHVNIRLIPPGIQ